MDINYYTKTGRGKDIVFLHGWMQDRHTWDIVVDQLKDEFTCWTLDLPGFGTNPRPKTTWNPRHYAKWVLDFIKQNNVKNPLIVGHSFGGRVAIELAIMDIPYTQYVLYATPGLRQPLSRFTTISQAMYKSIKKRWLPLDKLPLVTRIKDRFRSADAKSAKAMYDIFAASIDFDLTPSMVKISQPTLLIWGENDAEVPLKIGMAMQQAIANSKLKTIPKATHFAHFEQPKLFAGILRKFISDYE